MTDDNRGTDVSRREFAVGAAGLLGTAALGGPGAGRAATHGRTAAAASTATREGVAGPVVEELGDGLYWLAAGGAQMMFATTGEGVVAVDAPPSIGRGILDGIRSVTDEPITHVVYSHYHADHIGGASLYPDDAEYVAHTETAALLDRFGGENRPSPTTVFGPREVTPPGRSPGGGSSPGDSPAGGSADPDPRHVVGNAFTLEVGDQRLELEYRGPNNSPDNVFVHAPDQEVLMFVDVVFPGWIPFQNLAFASDVPGFVRAHDRILEYDFETFVGGHVNRLGTREDVERQRAFVHDLKDNASTAIETVDPTPFFREYGQDRPWKLFEAYLAELARVAAEPTLETWGDELRGAEVFMESHAAAMVESLRIDYGQLGPFGL